VLGQDNRWSTGHPFFEEGGRLTVNDTHYVAEQEMLVAPRRNRIRQGCHLWIQELLTFANGSSEKSKGRIKAEDVAFDRLDYNPPGWARVGCPALETSCKGEQVCVVNAASFRGWICYS